MSNFEEEKKVSGVFGGVEMNQEPQQQASVFGGASFSENQEQQRNKSLPTKTGFWTKFKAFWLQDIDWNKEIVVELTPYEQKVEDEINDFLHQDVSWKKLYNFLFQDVSLGKK